jgi:membrane-bound serine protease (ClpP class)
MRATAEAHGKDTVINGKDTTIRWRRDPRIAEAMVDPVINIPGIIDSGKVLTFTAEEALRNGYCEGLAGSINEILAMADIREYKLAEFKPTSLDKIIGFLLNPVVHGLLIILIIGGIYYELQTPGIGFPLGVAVLAAILYFAPLYLEGLAQNWEILIFILGAVLLLVEIFAIPGFGVTGITGIILIITGLTMAMVDNVVFESGNLETAFHAVIKAFFIVIISLFISVAGGLLLAGRFMNSPLFSKIALNTVQKKEEGFTSADAGMDILIGKEGQAYTVLRPSGKILIGDDIYDAKAEYGFINKGEIIKVLRYETGQLYVDKV